MWCSKKRERTNWCWGLRERMLSTCYLCPFFFPFLHLIFPLLPTWILAQDFSDSLSLKFSQNVKKTLKLLLTFLLFKRLTKIWDKEGAKPQIPWPPFPLASHASEEPQLSSTAAPLQKFSLFALSLKIIINIKRYINFNNYPVITITRTDKHSSEQWKSLTPRWSRRQATWELD